jgi:hypothetical protein
MPEGNRHDVRVLERQYCPHAIVPVVFQKSARRGAREISAANGWNQQRSETCTMKADVELEVLSPHEVLVEEADFFEDVAAVAPTEDRISPHGGINCGSEF